MDEAGLLVRAATPADFPAVLALNAAWVRFLSPLDPARLQHLHGMSALHLVAEREARVVAFVLAFREGVAYDSVNYGWFAQRYPRFLYIDRVVVDVDARSVGAGTRLYREVFAAAARAGLPWVVCEYDIDPPNPVSERFHARLGFQEVGRQILDSSAKQVSLQRAPVPDSFG